MTYTFGPCCTCGQPYWSTVPQPCPVHGYPSYVYPSSPTTTLTWTSLTRVCQGRHCAHDDKCNKYVTRNGV